MYLWFSSLTLKWLKFDKHFIDLYVTLHVIVAQNAYFFESLPKKRDSRNRGLILKFVVYIIGAKCATLLWKKVLFSYFANYVLIYLLNI